MICKDNPKLLLTHWPILFSEDIVSNLKVSDGTVNWLCAAIRDARGILRNRNRYYQRNSLFNRPFTSLSDTVTICIRRIWMFAITKVHQYFGFIEVLLSICKVTHLNVFLAEDEILNLLNGFCWDWLDRAPQAFRIASVAAQSLCDGFVDSGLALKFISSNKHDASYCWDCWAFFRLLDYDDEELVMTAIGLLPSVDMILKSVTKIIDILLAKRWNHILIRS